MPDTILRPDPAPDLESSLRVCLLVGNNNIRHCGVKDYTYRLAEALAEHGIEAELHAPADWKVGSFLELRRRLRFGRFDVLHVQYPAIGFRYSLLPHLAGLSGIAPATCVTLHEYSRLPSLQRLSTHLFRLSSRTMLFTTDEERQSFMGGTSKGRRSFQVIPIASNVPEAPPADRTEPTVLYFGQIRPEKGIEAFLALASLSVTSAATIRFQIVGAYLPRHEEYLRGLRRNAPENVEWIVGADLNEVARRMSSAMAAYLPFPDGASYRRGSMIGALVNGLPVISSCSKATPDELASVILKADTPQQALAHLRLLQDTPERRVKVSAACRALGLHFCWGSVAEAHRLLYERLRSSEGRTHESRRFSP
jgi:glycosyltransferase involved in cell wall biosynthesis